MEIKEYLHRQFLQTNRIFPISDYVDLNKYPKQMDIVGTTQTLRYRWKDIQHQNYLTTPAHGDRPHDDTPDTYDSRDSQEWKDMYFVEDSFLVMRADAEEPYKFVAMDTNYGPFIVCDSRRWDDVLCHIIPGQDKRFLGLSVKPYFIDRLPDDISEFVEAIPEQRIIEDNGFLEAYTFSADVSEPGYCVIINYVGGDQYKVFLSDECLLEVLPSPDLDDLRTNMQLFRKMIIGGRRPYGTTE